MTDNKIYLTVGFMSGTSMDDVDAALIRTDGHGFIEHLGGISVPYLDGVRDMIRDCLNPDDSENMKIRIKGLEEILTQAHSHAFYQLMTHTKTNPDNIDLIGFHGHTLAHDPDHKMTLQIGDGAELARLTETDVICDFRSADVAAGGQGAPLVPVYHKALSHNLPHPLAYLNIGGVANITWIDGTDDQAKIIAFDTGPGNALIDDWILEKTDNNYDSNGDTARSGNINTDNLSQLMAHPYFDKKAPKSLDRNAFSSTPVKDLSLEDGAATLTAFTVKSIVQAVKMLPQAPEQWLISGGGRHNGLIIDLLKEQLNVPVDLIDKHGFNGDFTEAEAFAYLAVRSKLGLPISFPETTGVPAPMTGGVFHPASKIRQEKTS